MTTTTIYSREDLEALGLGELRKVFVAVTGLGPGTRKPVTLTSAILKQQQEQGDQDTDNTGNAPETSVVTTDDDATVNKVVELEPEVNVPTMNDDDQHQPEPTATEPTKVKVIGTGAHTGSTLLCDLVSHTGTVATVQVLGKEVRFRADSGEPVRMKKSWQAAGWVLDTDSLPKMEALSVEQLSKAKPADLSLAQLQQVYEHLSGRQTTSTSRTFLSARIRAAKAGTLPQGTRRARSGEPVKVLPVAMAVSVVEKMDAAWKRQGFYSRISFIRTALSKLLKELGEDDVAELLK